MFLWTTLAARIRTLGPGDMDTLITESSFASVLRCLGVCAQAGTLDRCTLEKMRRILGRDNYDTIAASGNFSTTMCR